MLPSSAYLQPYIYMENIPPSPKTPKKKKKALTKHVWQIKLEIFG